MLYAGMSRGKIIALGVGIAIAIAIGVALAVSVSAPAAKTSQINVNETAKGRHLEVNLEEKVGVKANP